MKKSKGGPALVFFTAIITPFFVCQCSEEERRETALLEGARPGVEFRGLNYTEQDRGKLRWELKANKAGLTRKNRQARLSKVEIIYYPKNDMYTSPFRIQGENGYADLQLKEGQLLGNVHGGNRKGREFRTDRINFSYKRKIFHTKSTVYIEGPDFKIRGKGFRWLLESDVFHLRNKVVANFRWQS